MKRTDLIALAEKLHQVSTEETLSFDELDDIKQAAAILRQIAESQPVAWRVEVRWTDITRDNGRWLKYADYATEKGAKSLQQRFSNPGDIETRAVPIYTLPLED